MKSPYDKSNTIQKAASLIRGDRLMELYDICENQKSISTQKLLIYIERLHEGMRLDGIHFSELAKRMDDNSKEGKQ